jgi:hypothetical protein
VSSVHSDPERSEAPIPGRRGQADATGDHGEEIDALPVLADESTVVWPYPFAGALGRSRSSGGAVIPAVQAAAVAAGGFVAGAAVVGLVHRHRDSAAPAKRRRGGRGLGRGGRSLGRGARAGRSGDRAGELVQIIGSRSLLLDVHLLGGRD